MATRSFIAQLRSTLKVWPRPTTEQWEIMQKAVPQLISEVEWVKVSDRLPVHLPGFPSDPVMVFAREFGQAGSFAVARCWQSTGKGQIVKWYLDSDFYHLERPYEIAEPVICWRPMPSAASIPEFADVRAS